jgi:glutathione S-transferase
MAERLVLHEYSASGNCYKVRLTAALTGVHLERREYDIMTGETRTKAFLENISPNGRIPVLQVGERFISESNAACYYLADGSNLIPAERFDRSDMLRWMFFEQYNHEPNIATLRFWMCSLGVENLTEAQRMQMAGKRQSGIAALTLMDDHLQSHQWLVGGAMSLADICLFAYTHVAGDADFSLEAYPHITDWIERIKGQPAYLPMDA